MKRLVLVVVIAATALPTLLSAATKSYDVVPYRDCIAQTDSVAPNNKISQYVRNTLDSLTFVWVWVGDTITGISGTQYLIDLGARSHFLVRTASRLLNRPCWCLPPDSSLTTRLVSTSRASW